MKKNIKIGINGFGRIGRCLLRLGLKNIDIVAVNSRASIDMAAHLLQYDSVHGTSSEPVVVEQGGSIKQGAKMITYVSHGHPSEIPWEKWGVDWVLECSGIFKTKEDLEGHFKGGAKKVFVSAPVEPADFTMIYGLNHKEFSPAKHNIISAGSCTTNCLAPLIKTVDESFKIKQLMFTTVHSYTQDQKLLDSSHKKDFRRARAGTLSMIPTSTGAAHTLKKVFPHLKDNIKGMAIRVPTPNVSLVDMVFQSEKPISKESLNQSFLSTEKTFLKGVLSCESKELVSVDFNGNPHSTIVDLPSTEVLENTTEGESGNMAKVLAWYDNEIGFSQRMIDFLQYVEREKHL